MASLGAIGSSSACHEDAKKHKLHKMGDCYKPQNLTLYPLENPGPIPSCIETVTAICYGIFWFVQDL